MTKKKVTTKHSKELKLGGPKPDFSKYKILKNQEIPVTRQTASTWDHLIAKLDKGDSIDMNKKDSHSIANRARNLGYVIVLRKQAEDLFCVWFGGLAK